MHFQRQLQLHKNQQPHFHGQPRETPVLLLLLILLQPRTHAHKSEDHRLERRAKRWCVLSLHAQSVQMRTV